jgi:sigma-B regulation protein RsbU (phosphoserine phosphatase)
MKLSPGRRVLLLAAFILLVSPVWQLQWNQNTATAPNLSFLGGIALLVLLALELADRVSLKRDLEIAREIQNWLMPAVPPQGPGLDCVRQARG